MLRLTVSDDIELRSRLGAVPIGLRASGKKWPLF